MPVIDGMPVETGDFQEDGVVFPAAGIVLEFIEGEDSMTALLPTGNIVDVLEVPGVGRIEATLLTAGNLTVFIEASALGISGKELPAEMNADGPLLTRCEPIRAQAAVIMGLAPDMASATRERPATPKLSWVAPAADYVSSVNVMVNADQIDVLACNLCKVTSERQTEVVRIGHASGRLSIGATVCHARAAGKWIRQSCHAVCVS